MAEPTSEAAQSYGEGDIEAKAMTDAAKGGKPPAAKTKTPPSDVALPVAGTTETNLARNLKEKAERAKR